MQKASADSVTALQLDKSTNNNNKRASQPGLGACGATLSSPSRLVLVDLKGAGNR